MPGSSDLEDQIYKQYHWSSLFFELDAISNTIHSINNRTDVKLGFIGATNVQCTWKFVFQQPIDQLEHTAQLDISDVFKCSAYITRPHDLNDIDQTHNYHIFDSRSMYWTGSYDPKSLHFCTIV